MTPRFGTFVCHVVPVWCVNCLRRHFVFVFIVSLLCGFIFCLSSDFDIMYFSILFFLHSHFFAHSRQRKLNLFHLGTIFSISFVHLSLKNKKLNLFHPILNIGQGKGPFCQKNLKLDLFNPISKIGQGKGRFCQKNLKTQSIQSHSKNKAG